MPFPSSSCCDQIFGDPSLADQRFPGCGTLNFGHVLGKLVAAANCAPLKERLEGGQRVQKLDATEMSATNGYTSRVFRCQITMAGGKKKNVPLPTADQLTLILKVFSLDRIDTLMANFIGQENMEEMMREMAKKDGDRKKKDNCGENEGDEAGGNPHHQFFMQMHRNECAFYGFIGNSRGDGEGHPPPPVPLPKIYFTQLGQAEGGQSAGLIAMEDMHATHLADFANGLNEEQVLGLITHLANLHAHLMTPGIGNWQALFVRLEDVFRNEEEGEEGMRKFFECMLGQLDGQMKDEFMVSLRRLGNVLQNKEFAAWARKRIEQEYGMPEMLVHGDLWINNILWHDAQPNQVAALIDWQLAARGNPMTDIARLLLVNTEPELRHGLERNGRMLGHYLTALNGKLGEKGLDPVEYGVEELCHAYNLAMVGQAFASIFLITLFQRTWADHPDRDRKLGRLFQRATAAMRDAVEAMEREAPEWMLPLEEVKKEVMEEEEKKEGSK